MTDEDALIQAIIATPDDNANRLVYADWLDEHGQAQRAHLIRAQIAGKSLGLKPRGLRDMFPYVNVSMPIRLGSDRPIEPLVSPGRAVFVRRGFIDEVRVRWATWLHIGAEVVARNPVRYVGIQGIRIESSRDGDIPREDVLWLWEGLPFALRPVVPEEWLASNTRSERHCFHLLSKIIIAVSLNDYDTVRKLRRRWGRPTTDRD